MESDVASTLQTLRDIQGIQGSFVIDAKDGQLLERDLPRLIDDGALAQVGPRICRLFDVIESEQATESSALRFAEHRLDIRHLGAINLCVLADANVNLPALRMAMKLVSRKLEAHDFSAPKDEPAPPTSKSVAAEKAPVTGGIWRGHRY